MKARIFTLLALFATATYADYGPNPDAPEAERAAQRALAHADIRSLHGERRAILGLKTGLVATSMPLEQAMQALDARVLDQVIEVSLSSDVLFDFDSHRLKEAAETSLNALLSILQQSAVEKVEITGHTDAKGSDAYNMELSLRRARFVSQWLMDHGISPELLVIQGEGEREPVAANQNPDGSDNPQGRAKNRRVEIRVHTRQQNL